MDRRSFMKSAAEAVAAAGVVTNIQSRLGPGTNMMALAPNEIIERFVEQNDSLIDSILPAQQNDERKRFYGGFSGTYALFPVGKAAWFANRMVCGLISPKSRHFQSNAVASSVLKALKFIKSQQHADGTIDLTSTNFHSPPDTGFVVEPVALTLSIIRKHANDQYEEIQSTAVAFLELAGQAMVQGGIHTPNHRWVVCMALARINELIPSESFVHRIEQWLSEKIDIDSEGHYAERSTSIYSPLTNRCLITVARLFNRPNLLDPVRKNLELTPYLVHANGELVTEVSRRQDQFRVAKMENYFYPYYYMAIKDKNAQFSAMIEFIAQTVGLPNLYGNLTYFLDDQDLQNAPPPAGKTPDDFEKTFSRSKTVRIRRKKTDATIIADNETFLTVHKGDAAIRAVRLASAFFGKGQFKSRSFEVSDSGYILKQSLTAAYYQPLAKEHLPGNGDWRVMPKHHRRQTEIQKLQSVVRVSEHQGVFTVQFDVTGTDNVPLAIELAFGGEGKLDGVEQVDGIGDAFLSRQNTFAYTVGNDKIEIGVSSSSQHAWTQIRGALPKLDGQCVYITGFTPFPLEMTIS